ncbi:hypothetical protein [uncultured Meiothermus sp.]|nr:hypothetical protein [uncultured Meiothermus sp.]
MATTGLMDAQPIYVEALGHPAGRFAQIGKSDKMGDNPSFLRR